MQLDKVCLIRQPGGLGDIIFCQKIAKKIQTNTEYKTVIWPVAPAYAYLNKYLIGENVNYCDEREAFPHKEVYLSRQPNILQSDTFLYLPLESANHVLKTCKCHNDPVGNGVMKYDLCSISSEDWVDYFEFRRDENREDHLVKALGIDLREPYNLINENFGTFPHFCVREPKINPNNGLKNIYMNFYEGVILFDWIKVFENATEIHTVETCLPYLFEKMKLKNVFVYWKNDVFKNAACLRAQYKSDWNFLD